MQIRNAALFAAAGLLLGCATQPDKLSTQYVSPVQYKDFDCNQIGMEMQRVSRRVNELYRGLKKSADDDSAQMGIGLVVFWPALFFLEGGDGPEAAEYSRLKGEYAALESSAVAKKCPVPENARITRWAVLAQKSVSEECHHPGIPELITTTGAREDYKIACDSGSPELVRCDASGCHTVE